ncbi:uncharacterized protein%2C YhcH/YjgK/YiaL family [Chlamydia trachomatis]|nr:uncharacterized protein%2C YhcH/YjgK/YiaL family [Chlamydia trachomatis]
MVRFGVGFEKESLAFDPSKDIGFATCEYSLDMEMDPHHFVLFMPGELHQPNRTISGYERVEKYVFKVLLD